MNLSSKTRVETRVTLEIEMSLGELESLVKQVQANRKIAPALSGAQPELRELLGKLEAVEWKAFEMEQD